MDINNILKMLDWNNDIKIQQQGISYAEKIECINIFMQPMDKQYNKNIWENCALILSAKEDAMLTPYLLNLLDWLQDLTWPGSIIILERLKKYSDYRALNMAIENRVKVASALEDTNWISNISELLICDTLKESLDEEVLVIISKSL